MKARTIYCYHFKHFNELRIKAGLKPLFKIGDTTIEAPTPEDAAMLRINQQDSTSNLEPLIMDWAISIPDNFMSDIEHIDKEFHHWLMKNYDIYKYRKDKDREWFAAFINAEEAKSYLNEFLLGVHAVNNWNMRNAQKTACNKIINYFSNNGTEFLLAAKMRFGKNFTFLNAIKALEYKNVLILTYRPSVFDSLEDDIISHVNFANDFVYQSYKDQRNKLILNLNKVNIVSCSAQMAGYSYDEESDEETYENVDLRKNLQFLSNINWNLIVTDECHYGANTQNFKDICNTLNCNRILYISGTPFKTLGDFSDDAKYLYTYLDEQAEPDNKMPTLYQYALKMDSKLVKKYREQVEIVDYPTMSKCFQCTNDHFTYPDVAKGILDDVLHKGIRLRNMDNVKHMVIIFDHVDACIAASDYINQQYEKDYIGINCGGNNGISEVQDLKEIIAEAISDGKGTITCTCGRFIEGVSIKEWNCVIFCNDWRSVERYFQAMFRGQTPAEGKNNFYVVDYNPERMLALNHELILKLPTGNGSNTNNDQEANIREWLKATNIVVVDYNTDQIYTDVNYTDILKAVINGTISKNMFEDNRVFMRKHVIKSSLTKDDREYILSMLDTPEVCEDDEYPVNSNGVKGGKNKKRKKNKRGKTNTKDNAITDNEEKELAEIIASIKNVLKFIPKFLCVFGCKSLNDIIISLNKNNKNEQEFFNEIICDYKLFIKIINEYNIINPEGFNDICYMFWEDYNAFGCDFANAKDKHKCYIKWNLFR